LQEVTPSLYGFAKEQDATNVKKNRKLIQGNHRKYLVVAMCFLDNQFKEIGKKRLVATKHFLDNQLKEIT
jgi:hypothetical protein